MFDPGALMARHYRLPDGQRVGLRIARVRDQDGIRRLAAAAATAADGDGIDELELARLSHFDPRRRVVLCATALVNNVETIIAVGAIELGAPAPSMVLADERAEGIAELLMGALLGHARALADAA